MTGFESDPGDEQADGRCPNSLKLNLALDPFEQITTYFNAAHRRSRQL